MWSIGDLSDDTKLGQAPMRSPSVFNFFRPGYVPSQGELGTASVTAPEFQLCNEVTVAAYLNFIKGAIETGINDVVPNYSADDIALAKKPTDLVNRYSLLLTGDTLSVTNKGSITTAISGINGTSTRGKNGPVAINSIGNDLSVYQRPSCKTALNQILTSSSSSSTHWMDQEWMRVLKSSLDNQTKVTNGISSVSMSTTFQTDTLSAQLNIIAKLIAAGAANSSGMGVKRQVFFASLGGFDLHDNLMANHSKLLKNVNDAMYSFYKATEELGLQNQVTTFTASDFGRTLSSNGDGSDHGWGSHHMVMGGAVDGKKFWGKAPVLADNDTDTVGQGRLLPSTSVDEFAASMARWMGVSDSDLNTVLPNYAKFSSQTLPLFKPIIT